MNCARLRLNANTTTIFVRDGWLIIEASDSAELHDQLRNKEGSALLTVAQVSKRTGFTAGAVRDWIKRSLLKGVRVGKEYRIREGDLEKLIEGRSADAVSISKRIGRRRKPVMD
jgi:excisionase family DNA binding protein